MNPINGSADKKPRILNITEPPNLLYGVTDEQRTKIKIPATANNTAKPVAIVPRSTPSENHSFILPSNSTISVPPPGAAPLFVSRSQERVVAESPPDLDRVIEPSSTQSKRNTEEPEEMGTRQRRQDFERMVHQKIKDERRQFEEDRSETTDGVVRISINGSIIEEWDADELEKKLKEEEADREREIDAKMNPEPGPSSSSSASSSSRRSRKKGAKAPEDTEKQALVHSIVKNILKDASKQMDIEEKQKAASKIKKTPKSIKSGDEGDGEEEEVEEEEEEEEKEIENKYVAPVRGRGRGGRGARGGTRGGSRGGYRGGGRGRGRGRGGKWVRRTGTSSEQADENKKVVEKEEEVDDEEEDEDEQEDEEVAEEQKEVKEEEKDVKMEQDDMKTEEEEEEEEDDSNNDVKKPRKRITEIDKLLFMDFGPKEGGTLKQLEAAKNGRLSLTPRKATLPENRLSGSSHKRNADDSDEPGSSRRKRGRRSTRIENKSDFERDVTSTESTSPEEVQRKPKVKVQKKEEEEDEDYEEEMEEEVEEEVEEKVEKEEVKEEEKDVKEEIGDNSQVASDPKSPQPPQITSTPQPQPQPQSQPQSPPATAPPQPQPSAATVTPQPRPIQVQPVQAIEQVHPIRPIEQVQPLQPIEQVELTPSPEPEDPPAFGRIVNGVYLPAGGDLNYRAWTVDQMFEWVTHTTGSQASAEIFRVEEMDGTLIDYLTQDDLRNQLKLPFGPMMKVLRGMQEIKDLARQQ